MGQTLLVIFSGLALLISLLGWAYQLGFLGARVLRNEKDIDELRKNEKEYRADLNKNLSKIYDKLDALPCKNPDREKC